MSKTVTVPALPRKMVTLEIELARVKAAHVALCDMFDWNQSAEGYKYWDEVTDRLQLYIDAAR